MIASLTESRREVAPATRWRRRSAPRACGRPTRRARRPSVTPARSHFSTIATCHADSGPSNHSRTASAIVGPTPSVSASSCLVGLADRGHRAELGRQRPGGGRARRGGSRAPPAPARAGRPWPGRGRLSSRSPLAESTRPSVARSASLFFAARVKSVGPSAAWPRRGRRRRPRRRSRRPRAARGRPRTRGPRCRRRRGRRRGRPGRAAGPGTCGGWGSAGPCRPPSAGPAWSRTTGTRSASPTPPVPRAAAAAPGRRSRGSRRRPCAARRCRRGGRPCAGPRGRCGGWRARPSSRRPGCGSMTPNGVTRPVRPVLTSIESSLALTSSGGYLNAIAQRGARLVEPSRRCSETSSTFTTTPSIS